MRVFFISVLSSVSVFAHTLNVDILDLHVNDKSVYVALYKPNNRFPSLEPTFKDAEFSLQKNEKIKIQVGY